MAVLQVSHADLVLEGKVHLVLLLQDLQGVDAAPRTARIRGVTTADPLQASTPENQSLNQTFRYI